MEMKKFPFLDENILHFMRFMFWYRWIFIEMVDLSITFHF